LREGFRRKDGVEEGAKGGARGDFAWATSHALRYGHNQF